MVSFTLFPIYPLFAGEGLKYLADRRPGWHYSLSNHDASDVHSVLGRILWIRGSWQLFAGSQRWCILARLAASSVPLRAPRTDFRQSSFLALWRCTKPGARSPGRPNTVRWCLMFVGPQRGTGFWRIEFGVGGCIFGRFAYRSCWFVVVCTHIIACDHCVSLVCSVNKKY